MAFLPEASKGETGLCWIADAAFSSEASCKAASLSLLFFVIAAASLFFSTPLLSTSTPNLSLTPPPKKKKKKQEAKPTPKALPCSLPAPTATTPAVKGTDAWTATGGNEASKLR